MRSRSFVALGAVLALGASTAVRPVFMQEDKVPDPSEVTLAVGDQFGWTVRTHGRYAVVGAPQRNNSEGAAFVFRQEAIGWVLEETLDDAFPGVSLSAGEEFGRGLSIHEDRIAVGAPRNGTGRVWIFRRDLAGWTVEKEVVPAPTASEYGEAVSLWDDTLAIGEPGNHAVHVLRRFGTSWEREALLEPNDPEPGADPARFAAVLSLYQNELLVGAEQWGMGPPNPRTGAAYHFRRIGNTWRKVERIDDPSPVNEGDHFAEDVAIHGRYAVIGAAQKDPGGTSNQGLAYVYEWGANGRLVQVAELESSDGDVADTFGQHVAIRGRKLLVSAPFTDSGVGSVYQFNRVNGLWVEVAQYLRDPLEIGLFDRFGSDVSIDDYAWIGARQDDDTGAAYVWSLFP